MGLAGRIWVVTLLLAAASVMLTGYAGPLATHALALI